MTFDAYSRYYDLLYKHKDYGSEARYVAALMKKHGSDPNHLLEIGCGTGGHAREFSRMGLAITGIDLSEAMVAEARRRSQGINSLEFQVASSTNFLFQQTFPAAVSLFHVMSYHTSNEMVLAALRNVSKHLQPGGLFVFDCWHGPGVISEPPSVRVRRMGDDRCQVLRIAEPTMRWPENVVDVNYEVQVRDAASGNTEVIRELHPMRFFFRPELELFLQFAGFVLEGWYPWLQSSGTPGPETWYAVAIGRKA
jgi:SAM-dependent methyltransferase